MRVFPDSGRYLDVGAAGHIPQLFAPDRVMSLG
jgi:hypothetical protein